VSHCRFYFDEDTSDADLVVALRARQVEITFNGEIRTAPPQRRDGRRERSPAEPEIRNPSSEIRALVTPDPIPLPPFLCQAPHRDSGRTAFYERR
jgi:hypothetical protein